MKLRANLGKHSERAWYAGPTILTRMYPGSLEILEQWLSTFLKLRLLNTVLHVVVNPSHKIMLLHN